MAPDVPPPARMTWKQLALIVLGVAAIVALILFALGGDWSRLFPSK